MANDIHKSPGSVPPFDDRLDMYNRLEELDVTLFRNAISEISTNTDSELPNTRLNRASL